MKKVFFILSLFILCMQFSAFAQKSRVGIVAGPVFSNLRGTVNGTKLDGITKPGLSAGFIVDAPIKNHISFQPGLAYMQKGTITQKPSGDPTKKDTKSTELRYADLALNFVYNTNGPKANFYIGAGPYVGFNLPSKFLIKSPGNIKTESDLTFGNETQTYRGVDFGANAVTGYRFKCGVFLAANYSLGLRNLIPDGSTSTGDTKNTCFGVSLGWLISNK